MPSADAIYNMSALGILATLVLGVAFKGIPIAFKFHKEAMGDLIASSEKVMMKHIEDHKTAVTTATTAHKAAVERIVTAFEKESDECRKERVETAKLFSSEQEKNRQVIANLIHPKANN